MAIRFQLQASHGRDLFAMRGFVVWHVFVQFRFDSSFEFELTCTSIFKLKER